MTRVVLAHLGCECRDVLGRDIGRIGNDKIELPLKRRGVVARDEIRASAKFKPLRIAARHIERIRGDVGADAVRVWQFGKERKQDRARAGAEIGDAQRARAIDQ